MPPRPNPLEEPVFSVDLATNQQRFYATGEWENITGTFGNSTLARVLFGVLAKAAQLHKDNLKDFPDFLKFLLSNHDIEDTGSVGEWVTKRGIFVGNSIVGLWVKLNATQDTIDEMVIKQACARTGLHMAYSPPDETMRDPNHPATGIAMEAVFQVGLQQQQRWEIESKVFDYRAGTRSGTILHLRQYKFQDDLKRVRFYQTFAPHGTVSDLVNTYNAFQQRVPESFYWYLLHSLASACPVMGNPLKEDAFLYNIPGRARVPNHDDYMLHVDIKPLNIVLDYAELEDNGAPDRIYDGLDKPEDFTQLYPVVKLMDFGMVHDTNPTNERNPHDCTYGWQAPEMLHWGDEFQNPPNPPDLKMDGRLMVWNIGKIVYDAIGPSPEGDIYDHYLRRYEVHPVEAEEQYLRNGGHFLPPEPIAGYSQQLATLVYSCLHPSVAKRPVVFDLWQQTRRWLDDWNRKLQTASLDEILKHRLYFRGREIESLGLGDYDCPINSYGSYLRAKYQNPEESLDIPLKPEYQFAKDQNHRWNPPTHIYVRPNDIQFGVPHPYQPPQPPPVAQGQVAQGPAAPVPAPNVSPGPEARKATYQAMPFPRIRAEVKRLNLNCKKGGKGVNKTYLIDALLAHHEENKQARDAQ